MDIIPVSENKSKRLIADLLRVTGDFTVSDPEGNRISRATYLAHMIWEGITLGVITYADGGTLAISKFDQWAELVRFMSSHVDGPVTASSQFNGINVFKVYNSIDVEKV